MATERKRKGRQKVDMVRMEKDANLQVTFSKRRSGLFKKASELCTLCGAQAAIIVFSPGKKAFSFGHPSVDSVINRFLAPNPSSNANIEQPVEAQHDANFRELNLRLTLLNNQLEAEKKRGEELNEMRKAGQGQFWWHAPVEELGLQQLEELKRALEELKGNVILHNNKLLMEITNPPPLMRINPMEDFNGPIFNYPNDLGHCFF